MKAELDNFEARKAQLTDQQARAQVPPPLLHPNMAELYREKVAELHAALNSDDRRAGAADILRTLISAIVLTPNDGKLAMLRQPPSRMIAPMPMPRAGNSGISR